MPRRSSLSTVLLFAVLALASRDAAIVVERPHPRLRTKGAMQSALRTSYPAQTQNYLQTASPDFAPIVFVRQQELVSDQTQEDSNGSDGDPSDDAAKDAAAGDDNAEVSSGHDPNATDGTPDTAIDSATAAGEATSADGEATSSDGVPTSDGDATPSDGDATPSDGVATSGDGVATSADGRSTAVDGEATPADGVATSTNGDASSSDGAANSSDGAAPSSGDKATSDSNSEAPTQNVPQGDNTGSESTGQQVQEENESATSGGEQTSGNATDPIEAFTLMQMIEIPSGGGFGQITIFENASFVGPFANAPNTSSLDGLTDPNNEEWYTDSEYADRIAFQFTYTPESKDFVISQPVVGTGSTSGIIPVVEDFTNDLSTGGGSFTVLYRCQRGAPQTSYVTFKLQVTAERAIETIWTKKCGSGRHEHLEFGFRAHDRSVSLFNPDGTYGIDERRTLEVGPLETSTELVMELVSPAQNLQFLDPYISSDSESVSVQLRGTISKGTLSVDDPTSFSILYECKSATTATISFTVEIPPWDNVTAQWRKDCGGSHSEALLIGTTGKDSYDVMQDGELASQYNVTDKTTLDDADGVVELIPPNVDTQRFYITNSDDTSDIHIQTITATMSNPEVVTAVVNTPALGTRSFIPPTGDVIQRHETKSLSLHFMCKREGKSLVLVTLPTLRYKNVEFGFIKQCNEPRAYHHSGFLQTAGSLMAAFLFLGVVGAIATCIYHKRRQGAKYTAVPTNDPTIP